VQDDLCNIYSDSHFFLTEKIFLISMIFMEWYLGNEVTENSYSPSVLGMLESIEVCMKR